MNIFLGFVMLSVSVLLTSSSIETIEQEIIREFEKELKAKAQKQPVLILIGGFQGSGKSSLAARIKNIYDINVISTDAIRQSLFNREISVSPEFSKYVNNIYKSLIKKSLSSHSNILIDANAHSKRIEEIGNLLKESDSPHTIIKIFLNASEINLKNRVKARKPLADCYQGTESDLEAALSTTKINLEEYDLIVETDQLSENNVFEQVNEFILPYTQTTSRVGF